MKFLKHIQRHDRPSLVARLMNTFTDKWSFKKIYEQLFVLCINNLFVNFW